MLTFDPFRSCVDFTFILYARAAQGFRLCGGKNPVSNSSILWYNDSSRLLQTHVQQKSGGNSSWLRNLRARKPNKTCWKPSRENLWRAISTPTSHRRRARTAMCRLPNCSKQPRRTRRNTPKCGSSCWRAAKSRIPRRTCCTQPRARTPSGQTCTSAWQRKRTPRVSRRLRINSAWSPPSRRRMRNAIAACWRT